VSNDFLSPETWDKIKKSNALGTHQLERDRAFIERAIATYKRQRSAHKTERRLVGQTRDSAAKTLVLLTRLLNCEGYFLIGVPEDGSSGPDSQIIRQAVEAMGRLEQEMERTIDRFDHAREQLYFPQHGALEELAFDLLMTHAASLGRAPPTSGHQSVHNPGFVELVRLCAQAAVRIPRIAAMDSD
jgi:hypothetical protein